MTQDGRDYQQQQALLAGMFEETGTDIFVSSYTIRENKDTGAWISYAVWGEGMDTLLPVVDEVAFIRNTKPEGEFHGVARWDRVVEVLGGLLEATNHLPTRYRVRAFPTDSQLREIACAP